MHTTADDDKFMAEALAEARRGYEEGGIPIGAVLVHDGEIIGRGRNKRVQEGSVIKHGEMDCLENAGRLRADFYKRCTLYTTLYPCAMCSGAINFYGIPRVVVGEMDERCEKMSLSEPRFQPVSEVVILNDKNCIDLMGKFAREKRELYMEDISC